MVEDARPSPSVPSTTASFPIPGSLGSAMEELDTDTADAIIEEFGQYGFEPAEQEIIDELAVAVKNLDSDAAAELINKLS